MDNDFFFVAARSEAENGGIYTIDARSLEVRSFARMPSVSYLAFSLAGRKDLLYGVGKGLSGENYLGIWQVDGSGMLTLLDQRFTHGVSSCHLTTSPDGNWIYCASYSSGSLCEFKLKDGLFCEDDCCKDLQMSGILGPNPKRQEKPHPHCTVFTPDGKYLCMPDLGLDEVLIYAYSEEKGISEKEVFRYRSANPGAGPRHLLFAPDGKKAYLANEVDSTVSVLSYEDGKLTHCCTLPTLKSPDEKNTVAAIRFSPDMKLLCVSNRGDETVACYRIGEDGLLSDCRFIPVQGKNPRDINFLPNGIFASCNEFTNDVTFFRYNGEGQGSFEFLAEKTLSLPGPLCVIPK